MDKEYSIQFFSCLLEALQKCCQEYLKFEQAVELSGYLSLEIDNYKKERYVLSEMVHGTGDVISESYCVKAFKTMKQVLHVKTPSAFEISSDTRVSTEVDFGQMDALAYPDANVSDYTNNAVQSSSTIPRLNRQTVRPVDSKHSQVTSPSETSGVYHPSSVEISSEKMYPFIQAEPDQNGVTSHFSNESQIRPRTCIQLLRGVPSSTANVNSSCSVFGQSSCKETASTLHNVGEKNDQILMHRGVKRNASVIDISVNSVCKKERMPPENSIPPSTSEESDNLTPLHIQSIEQEELQVKSESDSTFQCYTSKMSERHTQKTSPPNTKNGSFHRCDQCDYKTLYTTHLRNHQKIHTREFCPCPLCPRKFADKSQLVFHLKIHAGRLTCSVCKKRFPSLKLMKQHQQLHRDHRT